MFEHFVPLSNEEARRRLAPPFLSEQARQLIDRAAATHLPVHIFGPPGCGLHEMANAMHALRAGGRFVVLPVSGLGRALDAGRLLRRSRKAPAAPPAVPHLAGTAFIPALERADDRAQEHIAALLDGAGRLLLRAGLSFRLVTAASVPLLELAERGRFSLELAHRLTVMPVRVVPLRERPQDLPLLIEHLLADLSQALPPPLPRFGEAAIERMKQHPWGGDLAELRAVVARTLALHRGERIDADDVLFDAAVLPAAPGPAAALVAAAAPPRPPAADRTLELLVQELAHELKNPMVTVKTFAQLAQQIAAGEADMSELARLAGEAVDQMDAVVENLLRYTRFAEPVRAPLVLSEAVAAALDELAGGPPLEVEHAPDPAVTVHADREQLTYALANLLRALCGSPPSPLTLAITYRPPATLLVEARGGGADLARRLQRLIGIEAEDGAELLPLGMALARALIERNGGRLVVEERGVNVEF